MADEKSLLIGYARVSTDDQNLDLQRDALAKAGVLPGNIHEEKASGAAGKKRVALTAAFHQLRPGDVLVVWKLDRLGRNLEELIRTVRTIEAKKAHFRCLTQPMDTTTPMGTLIFHIFGAMAEFERALIRERTLAGLAAARSRGRVGGRRPMLTNEKADRARAMLAAGKSVTEVAAALKAARSTVYKWRDAIRPNPTVHDPATDEVTGK